MALPFLKPKAKPEYYLALVLRNERATSILFSKAGSTIKYLGHGEENFENNIEDVTSEQFLETLDKSITQAESVLPDNIESHKTIFGLKDSWIEDNKIKKENLEKLKKASTELGLEPIGFLVSSESIINLLQKEEGAPVTAVLVEMGEKYLTVSFVKSGKVLETRSSEIHQSAPFTVDTLLKHFQTPEVMPSRVVIYGADDEELAQEFIGHKWSKSLPFLHLPQITSMPKDAPIKAMLLGAATQMGAQLLYDSSNIDFDEEPKKISAEEFENFEPVKAPDKEPSSAEADAEAQEPETEVKKEEPHSAQASRGEEPKLDYVGKDESLEYFGFVEGSDVAKKAPSMEKAKIEKAPEKVVAEEVAEIPEEIKVEEEQKTGFVENALLLVSKGKDFGLNLFKQMRMLKMPKGRGILIIPAVIILLLIALFFWLIFSTKATVSLLVNPKADQKTSSVTFSSNQATDIGDNVIASQPVSVSEDGSMTISTTGKKDTGTPSKGKVTIFNVGDSISLDSGTVIVASNGLKYTLDSAIKVASGDATLASTASVNVTANDIGQDYNLPSGTKFTVSGQDSSVAAKNDNAFSGGTKKTVAVVVSDDIQKLLDGLPKQLEDKAKNDIKSKVTGDNVLLNNFVDESVDSDKQTFDKKVGDQASTVTLKGTVNFTTLTYNKADMLKLADSLFNASGSQISENNLSVNAKNITIDKNGDVSADLTINAGLLPKIDQQEVVKQIAGISVQKARNILLNMPQVENVGIDLKPNLFFLSQNLPGNPKNIIIQITSK
jgi:hypothetical protein